MSSHACPERLMLPEALDGRLEPAEEKRVMAHLQTCSTCQDAAADIETALISLAVLRDEREHPPVAPAAPLVLAAVDAPSAPAGGLGPVDGSAVPPLPAPVGGRWGVRLMAAAAAVLLLAGGALIGRQLLPPRDTVDFGPAQALVPPATAADQSPRGSVAVAVQGAALTVRLDATALPPTGWYECVWVSGGQTRSAGSFRTTNGVVKDVRLRVAQPQDSSSWGLELLHHLGTATEVVLEGSASYHP